MLALAFLQASNAKRCSGHVRDRVDRFALRSTILVVDAIALIMPTHEACSDQIRHRSAYVTAPRLAHPRFDFLVDHAGRSPSIARQSLALT